MKKEKATFFENSDHTKNERKAIRRKRTRTTNVEGDKQKIVSIETTQKTSGNLRGEPRHIT